MTRLKFDPVKHRYYLDGKWIPGTTGIIGKAIENPSIVAWRARIGDAEADRIARESANFGVRVHALVESINLGTHRYRADGQLDTDNDLRSFGDAYLEWFQAEVVEVIGVETPLYSEEHWFAGTADGILMLRDRTRPTLVDIKTSKGDYPHDTWGVQLSAYQVSALESLGIVTTSRLVLRLPSDRPGKLIPVELPITEAAEDWQAFVDCRTGNRDGVTTWQQRRAAQRRRPLGRLVVPAAARR